MPSKDETVLTCWNNQQSWEIKTNGCRLLLIFCTLFVRIKESLSLNNCGITSLINYVPGGLERMARHGVWKELLFGKTPQQLKVPDKEPSSHPLPIPAHSPPALPTLGKTSGFGGGSRASIALVTVSLSLRLIMKILGVVGWTWFWRKCFQVSHMLTILRKTYHIDLKLHSCSMFFFFAILWWVWVHPGDTSRVGRVLCWEHCRVPVYQQRDQVVKVSPAQGTSFTGVRVEGWESRQLFSG